MASGKHEEEQPAEADANQSDEDVHKKEDVKAKGTQKDGNDAKTQTPVQRLESVEGDKPKDDATEHNKQVNRQMDPPPPAPKKGGEDKKEHKTEEKKSGGEDKKEDKKEEKKAAGGSDKKEEKKGGDEHKVEKKEEKKGGDEKKEEKKGGEDKKEGKQQTTEANSQKPEDQKLGGEKKAGQHSPDAMAKQGMKPPKDLKDHQDQSTPRGKAANDKPKSAETGAEDSAADQKKAGRKEEEKQAGGVKHNQTMADRDAATGDVADKGKLAPGGSSEEERKAAKETQKELNKKPAAEKK